ncbi:MAG: nitrous oxide reductase accessory protein NosL, partial [Alphaproteobacteria bacterium]|nr:nitrous oxide reductase accessory protein NosL [Alphaproteobacteria bacterium]
MRILLVTVISLLLAGCFSEEKTGAVDVHLDRDSCEMCRMLISDPRFMAQVRGGPDMKAYKFDDIGDALHWINKKDWKNQASTEIWVADMNSEKSITWLDAKKAFYIDGQMTPMNYGYGALAEQSDKAVT